MPAADSEHTFSPRAAWYASGRPPYPDSVIDRIRRDPGLAPDAVVIDIGSGTGLSSDLFLRHGHTVFAVEPDPDMRRFAEDRLRAYPNFHSIDARAESVPLSDATADLIVCASAFHWLSPDLARREFRRLLRPGGAVAVLRNGRDGKAGPFMRAYASLFRRYAARLGARADRIGSVRDFFAGNPYRTAILDYDETLDFAALRSRLLSYSTIPLPGAPNHARMLEELRALFDAHAENDRVAFRSQITLHTGRLD